MLFLFQQGTSFNPDYEKRPLDQRATDRDICEAMHNSLYNRYSYAQNYYLTNNLNMILAKEGRPSILHIYDQEFFEQKEYLTKFHVKGIKIKLQQLIGFHKNAINAPRYFLEPISLDLVVDKNYTKKRKLRKKVYLETQAQLYSTNKFNLTHQFIQKKLLKYEPILKDLNDSKPTTLQLVELMKDFNPKIQKSLYFMIEMEQHHKKTAKEENAKINQFDQIVSNKNSNMSMSTKVSTTRIHKEQSIRNMSNYQNLVKMPESNNIIVAQNPNKQVLQHKFTKRPQLKIDTLIESVRIQEPQSTRVPSQSQALKSKPFYSPKGTIKPNINLRKAYLINNVIKLR